MYGVIGFFDKVFSGAIFKIIQDLNPQDDQRYASNAIQSNRITFKLSRVWYFLVHCRDVTGLRAQLPPSLCSSKVR